MIDELLFNDDPFVTVNKSYITYQNKIISLDEF